MTKSCKFGDGRPVFSKDMCSGHYKQVERNQPVTPVREYGIGHRRIAGAVSDARYERLKRHADANYGGSMYKLVQDVMSLFVDGLDE